MPEAHESELLARIAIASALAERVFGGEASAQAWLRAPKRKFDGRTPLELLATTDGADLVEEELLVIDEGYVA